MTVPELPELPELAVTGATGAVGGLVARELADRGHAQRLLVRSPERAPELPGATVVRSDYAHPGSDLDGVRTLFMVSAGESADRVDVHRAFIDRARAAGVEHIVYTSFYGAAPDCSFTLGRDHYATEELIRASGMHHTFLRDCFYADFLPEMAGADGVIRGPAEDGRVAAVARADVARAAVAVLLQPDRHRDRTYDLTGPEALTLTEAAEIITAVTGRSVTFHNETVEEAYRSRLRWPAPDWQYDAWVSTYTAIAAGEVAGVSDDVERLTGRPPLGLAELLG